MSKERQLQLKPGKGKSRRKSVKSEKIYIIHSDMYTGDEEITPLTSLWRQR